MSLTALALLAAIAIPQGAQQSIQREWIFYPNGGGIAAESGGVHVWHTSDGDTDAHAYAVFRLDMPAETASFEVDFRLLIGALGTCPARVELRAGATRYFSVSAEGLSGHVRAELMDRTVYLGAADDVWRAFRLVGADGKLDAFLYGRPIGTVTAKGAPDVLIFGGVKGERGTQTEAWLKLDDVRFRVPTKARANVPRIQATLTKLRQTQDRTASRAWRWAATVTIENMRDTPFDAFALSVLKLVTEEYLEHDLKPVRWAPELNRYTGFQPGDLVLKSGESATVEFVELSSAPTPSPKPARAYLRMDAAEVPLALPPP